MCNDYAVLVQQCKAENAKYVARLKRFGLRNSSIKRMSLESGLHPALSMDKIIVKFQLEMGCAILLLYCILD